MTDEIKYAAKEHLRKSLEMAKSYIDHNADEVFYSETKEDFPEAGDPNKIYIAKKEKALYQWNSDELKYEPIVNNDNVTGKVIYGGNASGF